MAVYRDEFGSIDKQEFENHLKARTRKEGYLEIVMYTPDPTIQIESVIANDKLDACDISTITDITKFTSNTIATLEENLWLLDGRFIVYQGRKVNGYISNTISDDTGKFETNPNMIVKLSQPAFVENFSVILNSAVPSGYPKNIKIHCYDSDNKALGTYTTDIEWTEDTGEVDEEGQPIYQIKLLETLPSVNFEINKEGVDHLLIEYGDTRFRNRRIRVSSLLFGKTLVLDQDSVLNVDYTDKTSYVCDTLPSRTFSFDVNNYNSMYNIDNPNNGYIKLDKQTRIRFRNGYNVCGYVYDSEGRVEMTDGVPEIDFDIERN